MSIFNSKPKELVKSLNTDLAEKFVSNETVMQLVNTGSKKIACNSATGQSQAFEKCSALASVVNKKAQSCKNARFAILDKNGKEIQAKSKDIDVFFNPNHLQSAAEFIASVAIYKNLHGKAYIAKEQLGAYTELYVIPNICVTEMQSGKKNPFEPFSDIEYYQVQIGTTLKKYRTDELFVISDIDASKDNAFIGVSRLVSLEETINTFVSSYEAATELMSNRGMLGIISLYDDSMPSIGANVLPQTKADTESVQNKLSKYGMLRNQFKYAITNKKANYVQVSSNIADLDLINIQNQCKKDIAYTYGVPAILLDMAGGTFSNVAEAQKSFYSDTIAPEVRSICESIIQILGITNVNIVPYFDHLECFQNAKQQQAAGLTNLVNALNNAVTGGLLDIEQAKLQLNDYLTV